MYNTNVRTLLPMVQSERGYLPPAPPAPRAGSPMNCLHWLPFAHPLVDHMAFGTQHDVDRLFEVLGWAGSILRAHSYIDSAGVSGSTCITEYMYELHRDYCTRRMYLSAASRLEVAEYASTTLQ